VAAAIRTLGRDAPGLLGEHLVHAGRPAEAVAPLALGVYAATDRADYAEAVRLGRLGLSAGDTTEPTPAHGELWVNLAWAAQYVRADLGEAAEMAGRCFAFTGAGWRPVHYAAEICLANLSSRRGDASGLVLRARRALAIAEEEGNIAFQDRARRLLGQGLAGDPDAAIPVLLSVTKHTPECWIQARMTLAGLARKSGDLEGAAAWLREAEEHINGVGWTVERRMSLHMQLGENARARDDLAEAERCFRMIDQDSHEYFWMPMNVGRLNLAMLAVMDGRSQDAVDLLAHLLDTQPKQRLEFGFATQLLCAAAADLGHWEEVERLWASTSRMFADKPGLLVTQPDCIRLNRLISERARAAGWLALAEEIDALGV
jgi:tetratricopeptide (TPR) repeat protein